MSSITKYFCDFCKDEVKDGNDLYIVELRFTFKRYTQDLQTKFCDKSADACEKCLIKFGLRKETKDQPAVEGKITVEDVIRGIVQNELNQTR